MSRSAEVLLTEVLLVSSICVAFASRPVVEPAAGHDQQQLQVNMVGLQVVRKIYMS